jgi:hypothetical protein
MVRIAIATIFYGQILEMMRLINSIPASAPVNYHIMVDGIFRYTKEKYPDLPEVSHTQVRTRLLNYTAERSLTCIPILVDKPNALEYDKRMAYLETIRRINEGGSSLKKNIDVLIIVDSDEYFTYPEGVTPEDAWDTFVKNMELAIKRTGGRHNVFGIRTFDKKVKIDSYCPRIWYKPEEMSYINNSHYHYANIIVEAGTIKQFQDNKINYCQHAHSVIKGVTLEHDHYYREKDYLDKREEYQKYLVKFEELVQSYRFDKDTAHKMAKQVPSKDFKPFDSW